MVNEYPTTWTLICRIFNETDIFGEVMKSLKWRQQYPDHFAGYDLVGQEDPGIPLIDYLDALLYPSQQDPPINLPYFFHAGETGQCLIIFFGFFNFYNWAWIWLFYNRNHATCK